MRSVIRNGRQNVYWLWILLKEQNSLWIDEIHWTFDSSRTFENQSLDSPMSDGQIEDEIDDHWYTEISTYVQIYLFLKELTWAVVVMDRDCGWYTSVATRRLTDSADLWRWWSVPVWLMKGRHEWIDVFSPYWPRDWLHRQPVDLLRVELISLRISVDLLSSFHRRNEIDESLEDVDRAFSNVLSAAQRRRIERTRRSSTTRLTKNRYERMWKFSSSRHICFSGLINMVCFCW